MSGGSPDLPVAGEDVRGGDPWVGNRRSGFALGNSGGRGPFYIVMDVEPVKGLVR